MELSTSSLQFLDPPCNLSGTQQRMSSSCSLQMSNWSCLCCLFRSNVSLVYLSPCLNPAAFHHQWNDLATAPSLKYMGDVLSRCHIVSAHVWHHLRQASAFYFQIDAFPKYEHKNSCLQSSAEWLRGKNDMQSVHKTITGLSCRCLRGVLEMRCKSMLGNGAHWTASAILAKPCHIDTMTTQSHMANHATHDLKKKKL